MTSEYNSLLSTQQSLQFIPKLFMFPEEWLYTDALGTVGTQSLPREAASPGGIAGGLPSQVGYPRGQDVAFISSWERMPAAPWVALWVANVLSPG